MGKIPQTPPPNPQPTLFPQPYKLNPLSIVKGRRTMVLLCWWNFQVISIILWEVRSHPLGGLPSLFGGLFCIFEWKVAALRLGCDIPYLCNSMYLLDYSSINSFHKCFCVNDVQIILPQLLDYINSYLDMLVLFFCFHMLYRVLQLKI